MSDVPKTKGIGTRKADVQDVHIRPNVLILVIKASGESAEDVLFHSRLIMKRRIPGRTSRWMMLRAMEDGYTPAQAQQDRGSTLRVEPIPTIAASAGRRKTCGRRFPGSQAVGEEQ